MHHGDDTDSALAGLAITAISLGETDATVGDTIVRQWRLTLVAFADVPQWAITDLLEAGVPVAAEITGRAPGSDREASRVVRGRVRTRGWAAVAAVVDVPGGAAADAPEAGVARAGEEERPGRRERRAEDRASRRVGGARG